MYEKINMTKARKLYAEHKDFIMVPCNMRPDSFMALNINATRFERMIDYPFDEMVNAFQYYNCTGAETGRRVAFYVKA